MKFFNFIYQVDITDCEIFERWFLSSDPPETKSWIKGCSTKHKEIRNLYRSKKTKNNKRLLIVNQDTNINIKAVRAPKGAESETDC